MSGPRPVRIGTRGSALALVQAHLVRDALAGVGVPSELVIIETDGDRRAPDTAWGEGAFVAAIERALLDGRVDLAVHSAKDVPTEEDARLTIAAFLPRADARDALVVRAGATVRSVDGLPSGSRVGTDSPRRTGFLRARRPDLDVHPLHGNVDTRLRRLDAGETDALLVACAGLDRLDRGDRITERLDVRLAPPAPGQGAIGVQCRTDDPATIVALQAIDDPDTRAAVLAERSFLRTAGGGCRAPIAAYATVDTDGRLHLLGAHVGTDGSRPQFGEAAGDIGDPEGLGRALATRLGLPDRGRPRVLLTRAVDQARPLADALRTAGLEPVAVPSIAVEPVESGGDLDRAASGLDAQDWVVVTSANGAAAILRAAERVHGALGMPRWAAVGAATAAALDAAGVDVAFTPTDAAADALAGQLPLRPGARILVVRGDLAGDRLALALRARGAIVDDVVGYRTREAPEAGVAPLRAAIDDGPVAAVVLTSGSTARGLRALGERAGVDATAIPAICIGDRTAASATAEGWHVLAIAPSPDPVDLARTTATALAVRPLETR